MLREIWRIPLMILWGEGSETRIILAHFFPLQWMCSCINIMKFSIFCSVLNFHCMSTQTTPRANNEPICHFYIVPSKQTVTKFTRMIILLIYTRGRRGRDHIVVGFTTTYAISAYQHWCCEFESRSRRGVQHYLIKFVSDLRQVGGFLHQ